MTGYRLARRLSCAPALLAERATGKANTKTLLLDVVTSLNVNGIVSNDIPAKLEGVAFGPDAVVNGATRHTLFVASNNDFIATLKNSNQPTGIDNQNMFFVFDVGGVDVRGFVPQSIYTEGDLLNLDPHGRGWTEGSRSGDSDRR